MTYYYDRRKFVKHSAILSAGTAMLGCGMGSKSYEGKVVRVGMIAVGTRGKVHLWELLKRDDVKVVALADPDKAMIAQARKMVVKSGKTAVKEYTDGPYDYRNLLKQEDIDAVIISSPWNWHLEQSLDAMNAGKAVGLEVGGAMKLQDCWDYVDAFERTGVPIMILENVCYRRDVLAVLNMVRAGVFGELLHMQGGYQHDIRQALFNDGISAEGVGVEFGEKGYGRAKWRTENYIHRNADNYPTHGLGPLATMININRGNLLTKLSSVATKARGLRRYIVTNPKGGPSHPNAKIDFKQGDIVSTQLQTANGETIVLTFDTCSPRPYNLGFRVQGTEGLWQEHIANSYEQGMIYLEDKSRTNHEDWDNPSDLFTNYDHPLWKQYEKQAKNNGMDFFILNAFIEAIKQKAPFPLDVYDLATWYAITPLSEQSIAQGGQLQDIPDFTKGKWQSRKPVNL